MIDAKTFDSLLNDVRRVLPAGLPPELEKNLRAALSAGLHKLDLVTREEFDVQSAVLARTRARLEALEQQVTALEKQLK
jgi:hypothetical protein